MVSIVIARTVSGRDWIKVVAQLLRSGWSLGELLDVLEKFCWASAHQRLLALFSSDLAEFACSIAALFLSWVSFSKSSLFLLSHLSGLHLTSCVELSKRRSAALSLLEYWERELCVRDFSPLARGFLVKLIHQTRVCVTFELLSEPSFVEEINGRPWRSRYGCLSLSCLRIVIQ